jgi:hypothetical protein
MSVGAWVLLALVAFLIWAIWKILEPSLPGGAVTGAGGKGLALGAQSTQHPNNKMPAGVRG